jgi:hypothetical protein
MPSRPIFEHAHRALQIAKGEIAHVRAPTVCLGGCLPAIIAKIKCKKNSSLILGTLSAGTAA